MTSTAALDATTAAWLSTLDPGLALLPRALPLPSTGLRLHDARWTPGEGCRLSYRSGPRWTPGFVAVEVTQDGWSRYDYRDDPRLPGLARAADPLVVGSLLAPVLGETPSGCRVEPVRFRSGSRCVLRYDARTRSGTTSLYAKVFRPERFGETAARGRQLAGASPDPGLVPDTTAAWPDLQVLLGFAVDGRPVSSLLWDPQLPAGERAALARQLGELLAGFHAVTGVRAPRWTADDQMASIAEAMGAVHRVDPPLATRLLRCLEILGVGLPAPEHHVLSHGSFRAGQVVRTAQGHLVALDTDRLSRSPAPRDLGAVLAHLAWQGARRPQLRPLLDATERALLEGYQDRAGHLDPPSLLWWRAAGLLQVAVRRYRRLEVAAWPAVPVLAEAVEDLLAADRTRRVRGGAPDALDCSQMSHVISLALPTDVDGSRRVVRVRSARVLADAPGRRRVIRYDVDGLDTGRTVPLVGKVFVELGRARLMHEHLHLLSTGPFSDGPLRVPTPVALVPSRHMVLYRSVDGIPLDRVHDPEPAVLGARAAAQWLARFHGSSVRLSRRLSLAHEQQSCRRWAALVGGALPEAAGPARNLAARWATALPMPDDDLTTSPIHKDFHAGHVMVGPGPVVHVLDLDEARLGDPAFDVAHFCTYLEAVCPGRAGLLQTAFLTEYAAAAGPPDPGRHAAYCAYTWLKIARQLALGSGPFRSTTDGDRERLVLSALSRGLTCLAR